MAPDWDVPPEISPFKPLPLLEICGRCGAPMEWWEEMAIVDVPNNRVVGGLCPSCASSLSP